MMRVIGAALLDVEDELVSLTELLRCVPELRATAEAMARITKPPEGNAGERMDCIGKAARSLMAAERDLYKTLSRPKRLDGGGGGGGDGSDGGGGGGSGSGDGSGNEGGGGGRDGLPPWNPLPAPDDDSLRQTDAVDLDCAADVVIATVRCRLLRLGALFSMIREMG